MSVRRLVHVSRFTALLGKSSNACLLDERERHVLTFCPCPDGKVEQVSKDDVIFLKCNLAETVAPCRPGAIWALGRPCKTRMAQ